MLRVRVNHSADTVGPGLSTFYFEGSTQAVADDAAAAVATFWASVEPYIVNYGIWSLDTQVAQINAVNGQLEGIFNVTPATGVGDVNSSQLALATQGLLQLRTGAIVGGRELRGRLYIPGPTETHNDVARPIGAYVTGLNSAANALIADTGNAWAVWSRTNGIFQEITSATCWSDWAIMRSRRD
jgi:hypothetical protein